MKTNKKQNIVEKSIIKVNKLLLLLLLLIISVSCNNSNENYNWSAAANYPYNLPVHGLITFLKDGEMIGNLSTGSFISATWSSLGVIQKTVPTGIIPDSIEVEWIDYTENCEYKGAAKLPVETIEKLFKQGYTKYINIGMAPRGNVCVWVENIEILRFKVKQIGKLKTLQEKQKIINDLPDNSELKNYLIHNPIDYKNWEKPDPRYELDFGFCSENNEYKLYHSFFITKEGMSFAVLKDYFENTKYGIPYGKPSSSDLNFGYFQINEEFNNKLHLPVYCKIEWESTEKSKLYFSTDIALPKDFEKRFTTSYINPKTRKKCNYNRLVFGVEKDGEHCIIWLDGPDKQEKLMRFKAKRGIMDDIGLNSGGYGTEVTYY